jgi:hypothetical protein
VRVTRLLAVVVALAAFWTSVAAAQAIPARGRFALFYDWSDRELTDGASYDSSQIIATLTFGSENSSEAGLIYGLDGRFATFPGSEERDDRSSLYEAWVGYQGDNGRWTLRLGQMWLHELGALGSVGGLFAQYRLPGQTPVGLFRFGIFGGLEPEILDVGYVDDIKKGGAYVAVDGNHGRKHLLGWVLIRNQDLTERSVLVFNNFIPIKRKFFLYQAMEYDLEGPAGVGSAELTYFFASIRYTFSRFVWLQGTYNYGRSIDTRRIADDIIFGRPVTPETLEGLLFESGRIRVTVRPWKKLRLWAGYGRDQNNRGDDWYDRTNFGFSLVDIIGFDLSGSFSQIDRGTSSYDTTYMSLGRSFGQKVYVSLDYITSLSVFRYEREDGGVLETRPESERFALSANVNLNRTFSLLITGEVMEHDDFDEIRALTGLIIRF